jgi:hypothetical protein
MIETRTVEVATCDACGWQEFTNQMGDFTEGYSLVIDQHATDTRHEAFACKETHIGKAARTALERWRHDETPLGHMFTTDGKLPKPTFAKNDTELPEHVVTAPGYADDDSDPHE